MILVESVNANAVTNIDMVKPIEARKPIPVSCRHVIALDIFPNLSLVSTHAEINIPMGFPKRSPNATPTMTFEEKRLEKSISIKFTPALDRAKIGMMQNATNGCSPCSKRCNAGTALVEASFTFEIISTCSFSNVITSFDGASSK